MKAMLLHKPGAALEPAALPLPEPGPGQVRVKVLACGVCRTDLHIVDGELPALPHPIIPGHEIVGRVDRLGPGASGVALGQRIGIPWLGWTCGACPSCRSGRENLCDQPLFTGYHLPGGYAEFAVADTRYCFPIPDGYSDSEAAPLLCAGLIGFRALRMAGVATNLGIYGFGAAAHIIAQVARAEGRRVFAFTRPADTVGQDFARALGAFWAGGSDESPPVPLDAAIIFAPAGPLVPQALAAVGKGGAVVCAGIHMSDIPGFPYRLLWQERSLRSVANLTRQDGLDFFAQLKKTPVRTEVTAFPLGAANQVLQALRQGKVQGAAVLIP